VLAQTLRCRCLLMCGFNISCAGRGRVVSRSFLLEYSPIKDVVVRVTECPKQNAKQLTEVHVVSSFLKPQASAVVQIHRKLCRKTLQNTDMTRSINQNTYVEHHMPRTNQRHIMGEPRLGIRVYYRQYQTV